MNTSPLGKILGGLGTAFGTALGTAVIYYTQPFLEPYINKYLPRRTAVAEAGAEASRQQERPAAADSKEVGQYPPSAPAGHSEAQHQAEYGEERGKNVELDAAEETERKRKKTPDKAGQTADERAEQQARRAAAVQTVAEEEPSDAVKARFRHREEALARFDFRKNEEWTTTVDNLKLFRSCSDAQQYARLVAESPERAKRLAEDLEDDAMMLIPKGAHLTVKATNADSLLPGESDIRKAEEGSDLARAFDSLTAASETLKHAAEASGLVSVRTRRMEVFWVLYRDLMEHTGAPAREEAAVQTVAEDERQRSTEAARSTESSAEQEPADAVQERFRRREEALARFDVRKDDEWTTTSDGMKLFRSRRDAQQYARLLAESPEKAKRLAKDWEDDAMMLIPKGAHLTVKATNADSLLPDEGDIRKAEEGSDLARAFESLTAASETLKRAAEARGLISVRTRRKQVFWVLYRDLLEHAAAPAREDSPEEEE